MTTLDQLKARFPQGKLAKEWCNKRLPLQLLRSNAGFYIGTADDEGPVSRESNEYFKDELTARKALETGQWTQKESP